MDEEKHIIFFDLDGTLLDIDERWYKLHFDLAKYYSFKPLPRNEYIWCKKEKIIEEEIIKKINILLNKIRLYKKKRLASIELQKYLLFDKVKPGVIALLTKLSKKYKLVLVTKRRKKKNCFTELRRLKILGYFSKILFVPYEKKYAIIKRRFHISEIKNALLIGDTEDDFRSAKQLAIKYILVADGARHKSVLEGIGAKNIVNTITQLNLY